MNRPRIGWIFLTTVVVANGGSVWLRAQGPQPTFGPSSVSPPNIVFNTPTTVTFTIRIDTPTVNPKTVELRRVDSNGNLLAKLGAMNDVGKSGDVVAGDRNFTARVTLNEPVVNKIYFRAAAAFRGNQQNAQSGQILLDVDPFALPPDPGEPGLRTLEGIDSDGDGARDDLQRWVGFARPSDQAKRQALLAAAKFEQRFLTSPSDSSVLISLDQQRRRARDCVESFEGIAEMSRLLRELLALSLNTRDRSVAYGAANAVVGARTYFLSDESQLRSACLP